MLLGQLLVLLQIGLGVFPLLVADLAALLQASHLRQLALTDATKLHAILRHRTHRIGSLHHRSSLGARVFRHLAAHLLLGATAMLLALLNGIHKLAR